MKKSIYNGIYLKKAKVDNYWCSQIYVHPNQIYIKSFSINKYGSEKSEIMAAKSYNDYVINNNLLSTHGKYLNELE